MERQDDPTIDGDIVLLRHIPPEGDRVQWDDNGIPTPASQNFRDKEDELSTYIAQEATCDQVLAGAGRPGFGLIQFTAGSVRTFFQSIKLSVILCRDNSDPIPGHVIICANITTTISRKFKKQVDWKWVSEERWPARLTPDEW